MQEKKTWSNCFRNNIISGHGKIADEKLICIQKFFCLNLFSWLNRQQPYKLTDGIFENQSQLFSTKRFDLALNILDYSIWNEDISSLKREQMNNGL